MRAAKEKSVTAKVLCVFGTRPEAIKMAPVVRKLRESPGLLTKVCVTAQHRQMLDQVLGIFGIQADHDLDLMTPGQDLFDVTSRVLLGMRDVLRSERPDVMLVHGDTTTCFAAGLAAFYENVALGHVEAGLRTGNLRAPFPEEANRSLVAKVCDYHFAPTERARQNLLAEATPDEKIWVTGNTVIDALLIARDMLPERPASYWEEHLGAELIGQVEAKPERFVLITGHRRENFGQGFRDLCMAIRRLAENHPNWLFVYPVHLNPNVQQPVNELLSGLTNVRLIDPLDYLPFVWLMDRCDLILTDSGGIQEEGPSLGKPVLVMRDVTERPEAVDAGTVLLVGTGQDKIVNAVEKVLLDQATYDAMAKAHNPYGDGRAAGRIAAALSERFSLAA